jgi:hypothetical protein
MVEFLLQAALLEQLVENKLAGSAWVRYRRPKYLGVVQDSRSAVLAREWERRPRSLEVADLL